VENKRFLEVLNWLFYQKKYFSVNPGVSKASRDFTKKLKAASRDQASSIAVLCWYHGFSTSVLGETRGQASLMRCGQPIRPVNRQAENDTLNLKALRPPLSRVDTGGSS